MSGSLCSADDVKTALEYSSDIGTLYDDLIGTICLAVGSVFDQRYQREFAQRSAGTEVFEVRTLLVDLAPFDLRTASAVVIDPEGTPGTLTSDQYRLAPAGGDPLSGTYKHLRISPLVTDLWQSETARYFGYATVSIAGAWGIFASGTVDPAVQRAAVVTAASWLDRAIDEYAIQGAEAPREIMPQRFTTWAIPSAAHLLMSPWARIGTV
jgi:hypothetical protein